MTFDYKAFEDDIKRLGYKFTQTHSLDEIKLYGCTIKNNKHLIKITIEYKTQISSNWSAYIIIRKLNDKQTAALIKYEILGPEHTIELLETL